MLSSKIRTGTYIELKLRALETTYAAQPAYSCGLRVVISFFGCNSFCRYLTKTRSKCGGPISCFMRLQRSSIRRSLPKPAARAQDIRLIVLVEVPTVHPTVAINNSWRHNALHDKELVGDFVLISPMSMSRLCRLRRELS